MFVFKPGKSFCQLAIVHEMNENELFLKSFFMSFVLWVDIFQMITNNISKYFTNDLRNVKNLFLCLF